MKTLLYLWQLPQNLIGFLLVKILKARPVVIGNNKIYITTSLFDTTACFGEYIFVDENLYEWLSILSLLDTVKHEEGHQKQSRMLGWFYLLIIGVPSVIRKIYCQTARKTDAWYHSGFPENWADKLGGIKK